MSKANSANLANREWSTGNSVTNSIPAKKMEWIKSKANNEFDTYEAK